MKIISTKDKIFLAGASGLAGSAILRALEKAKYGNKPENRILTPTHKELDLENHTKVEEWFIANRPSVVIIAAALVGGINANNTRPTDFLLKNLKIQTNIIESAWKYGARRVLFLGSSCIYPKHAKQPIREEELLSGELEKTNEWYAIAKIAGIKLGEALRKQYNFDMISLMPTNIYGKGDNYNKQESHVVAAMISRFEEAKEKNLKCVTCWGSGRPMRELLYADDLGDACVYALENWDPNKQESPKTINGDVLTYLNVGTGNDISIKDIAEKIAAHIGYNGKIEWDRTKPDGTEKKLLDIQRLTQMGWTAKTGLDKGIEMAINDYKKHKKERQNK